MQLFKRSRARESEGIPSGLLGECAAGHIGFAIALEVDHVIVRPVVVPSHRSARLAGFHCDFGIDPFSGSSGRVVSRLAEQADIGKSRCFAAYGALPLHLAFMALAGRPQR